MDIQKSQLIRIFAKLCELTKRSQSTNQGIFVETIKELANIYKSVGYANDTHRNITCNFRDEANMYKNNKVFQEFYAFLCRIQLYAHLRYEHFNWQ